MISREERLEQDNEELRKQREELIDEKYAYRALLVRLATEINTPTKEEQADVAAFGREEWVYCRQHMKPHLTGWCGVGVRDKVALGVKTANDAYEKCREWGFEIYSD